jgi:hypothetical protein
MPTRLCAGLCTMVLRGIILNTNKNPATRAREINNKNLPPFGPLGAGRGREGRGGGDWPPGPGGKGFLLMFGIRVRQCTVARIYVRTKCTLDPGSPGVPGSQAHTWVSGEAGTQKYTWDPRSSVYPGPGWTRVAGLPGARVYPAPARYALPPGRAEPHDTPHPPGKHSTRALQSRPLARSPK